jgi:transcriptional regulator with XRE-family HTH domain
MPFGLNDGSPGQRLRSMRLARGLTIRAVDEHSRRLVQAAGNHEFLVSHSTIINIEMHGQVPSLYKLHSFSVIYGVSLVELVSLYGLSLEVRKEMQGLVQFPNTHPVSASIYDSKVPPALPLNSEGGFRVTQVLSDRAKSFQEKTAINPQHAEFEGRLLGYVGLEDYTMSPLIRPGTLVQVDTGQCRVRSAAWQHELDRPIYFLEIREGYAFGWCEISGRHLRIIPHPLSGLPIRSFPFPDEVDILGRVCAATIFLCPHEADATPATRLGPRSIQPNSLRFAHQA